MKRSAIISVLSAAVVLCFGSCSGKSIESKASKEEQEHLCGGYTAQREITRQELELFRQVTGTGDLVLTPLTVATQVVSGLNYRFRCKYEDKKASGYCLVTIYQPLQGNAVLSSIEREE